MICVNKTLNNVETPLLIWGNPFEANGKEVIICVTGNPGITDFYIEFASELHKSLTLPVCVIGQAGHEVSANNEPILEENKCLYNVEGQLKHKVDLIENYIDKGCKIHLIGHSIGAWMIVELLNDNHDIFKRVASINLLFPTLQHIAETRNGKFINGFCRKILWFMLFLCQILQILPDSLCRFLLRIYLFLTSQPSYFIDRIKKVVNPTNLEKVFFLAFDEMEKVKSLNNEGIKKITHLSNVIYSSTDGWAPLEQMADLKKNHPHLRMIEAFNVKHSFVLKSSKLVADMVGDFITEINNVNNQN